MLFEKYGKSRVMKLYYRNWMLFRNLKVSYAQWSEEELIDAKSRINGFIGEKCGVRCYLLEF